MKTVSRRRFLKGAVTGGAMDLKATNTFVAPKQVVPQALAAPKAGSKMALQVPARSYTLLNLSLGWREAHG